mmetsp:Transcript_12097/g.35309  ORF Transcript_12097/g.35309 Transcript_12097/m.35309 type:complete len:681 (-) Transcript_12097:29-2071(-)
MVLGVGERRRANHRHWRYRKQWDSGEGACDDRSPGPKKQETVEPVVALAEDHHRGGGGVDDTMPLLRPLRRSLRSRSKAGSVASGRGSGMKKSFLGALSLRRIGGGNGGAGAEDCVHSDDDDCCCSDTSSSAPPSPGGCHPDNDAKAEAEAAVLRGKRNADDDDDDDWTEASAAAMSSVAALAAAVRRVSDAEAESVEARRRDMMSPPCSPMAREEEDESDTNEVGADLPPPLLPSVWEDETDEKKQTVEGDEPNNGICEEEEKKEEDAPAASSPPLLPPPPPSMASSQRRKFLAASRPGGGVTFADDHSSVDDPLAIVQRVSRLPDECYGGCRRGQERGEAFVLRNDRQDGPGEGGVVVVLLLCPSTKQFEMVRVSLPPASSSDSSSSSPTCGEVLTFARRRARFRPLRKQRYTGLCKLPSSVWSQEKTEEGDGIGGGPRLEGAVRATEEKKKSGEEEEEAPAPPPASPPREMINALRIETYGIGKECDDSDDEESAVGGDVLVAIPKGLTASEATKHARPILSDEKMRRIMRERLSPTKAPSAEARKRNNKESRRRHKRRRKGDSQRESVKSQEIAMAREFSPLSPRKVSRTRPVLRALSPRKMVLGILFAAVFLWLQWKKRANPLSETPIFWPAALLPAATLASTPGYREDNAGLLEECCPHEDTGDNDRSWLWPVR